MRSRVSRPAPPKPRPAPELDADKWARRNVALLRWALDQPPDEELDVNTMFGFSLQFNPMLIRDPYAGQMLPLVEAFRARGGAQAAEGEQGRELAQFVERLRLPEAERLKLAALQGRGARDERDARKRRPPDVSELADTILELPAEARAEHTPALLGQMEAAAREGNDWGRLGLAYLRLASYARLRGEGEQAAKYVDRLLEVVRDHPEFQDPKRGNTNAVVPATVASVMLDMGRRPQFEAFVESIPDGDARAELWIGLIAELAERGDFHWPAVLLERRLRPLRPEAADRLGAALRGEVALPPAPADRKKRLERSPADGRLRGAIEAVARGFAARGDVETAGRMLVAMQRDDNRFPAGRERLASHDWARLALLAAQNGYSAAAGRGFEQAVGALPPDPVMSPEEREEQARLVREAVTIGDYETASLMLNTSSVPGAYVRLRLARTYRRRGEPEKARAKLDEALAQAYGREDDAGSAMAGIAVELHATGDGERARRVLLDALERIEGVDFGFGGTSDVVTAAVRMGQVDLLDTLYEKSGPGGKLLLCIVASRHALYGVSEEED